MDYILLSHLETRAIIQHSQSLNREQWWRTDLNAAGIILNNSNVKVTAPDAF